MKIFSTLILLSMTLPLSLAEAKSKWCRQTDVFPLNSVQHPNTDALIKKMDIIWVIDDSYSMHAHQKNLRDNIKHFFSVLDGDSHVDFQMGMVTTGLNFVVDERTHKPLKLQSTSNEEHRKEFAKRMMFGLSGSSEEKGAEAILRYLLKQRHFVRKGSLVMINILTDEDDGSDDQAVASMQKLLQYLENEGNDVVVNLIAMEDKIEKYRANFSSVNTQTYPLMSDDFSKTMVAIAEKSMKSTYQKFELKFEAKTILSVNMQTKRKKRTIERYQTIDDSTIGVDLGFSEITSDTRVNVEYVHMCTAVDRNEVRELNKRIQDIKFEIGETKFVDPVAAIESIQKVYNFMEKHKDTSINLIGAVSHSVNPIKWLEISLASENNEVIAAYRLARERARLIKDSLEMMGIESNRIKSKGALPGFHRHWYSYLFEASMIDVLPGFHVASIIESDRRVILQVHQNFFKHDLE
jgi:hypothetical protein